MSQEKFVILLLVVMNILFSIILFIHRSNIFLVEKIFLDLIHNLLYLWNILLLFLIIKYFKNEKNTK